jgi:hypothetical protein
MEEIISYKSIFDKSVNVIILFEGNEMYDEFKPLFEQLGFGFASTNDRMVFLDGEVFSDGDDLNQDILRFIEAHEVSHVLLGHSTDRNDDDELDADLGAYILLNKKGLQDSVDLVVDAFNERHGINFKKSLLQRVSDKIF